MTSELASEAFRVLGEPRFGGILVVSDHASNRVPADIDLGIDPALLTEYVAIDIGVAEVAERMAAVPGIAAFLGNVSRLVCDFNREEDAPAVINVVTREEIRRWGYQSVAEELSHTVCFYLIDEHNLPNASVR